MSIGKTLGADVPFCMTGGLARVGGIGEELKPLPRPPVVPLAMVTPGGGLSTARVFRAWDEGGYPIVPADMDALADALSQGDLAHAHALSFNALEAPAVQLLPAVAEAIETFTRLGARFVRMTGSGSTVFAAFPTLEEAQAVASQVPGAIVTTTQF